MTTQLISDGSYYFEDGNCIFQVEDHAFKVHRHLFTQESSFFSDLLAQSKATNQNNIGAATENKGEKVDDMLMVEESVESFRVLCWGLYAEPIEIREQGNPETVNIPRLVALAQITQKYGLTFLEKWSINVLRVHWMADFASQAVPVTPPIRWGVDMIEQLLALSTKTDTIDLVFMRAIEAQWFSHSIDQTKTPSDVQRALEFADGLSSSRLRGLAYYHALRRFGMFRYCSLKWGHNSSGRRLVGPNTFESCNNLGGMLSELDPSYHPKLMRGFWCLMSFRRGHSLPDMRQDHVSCISAWQNAYPSSSLDFLAALEEGLRSAQTRSLCKTCKRAFQDHFQDLLVAFEDNLINYFE